MRRTCAALGVFILLVALRPGRVAAFDEFSDKHSPTHFMLTAKDLTLIIKGELELEFHDIEGRGGPGHDSPTDRKTLGTRSPFVEIDGFWLALRVGLGRHIGVFSVLEFRPDRAGVGAVWADSRWTGPAWLAHHVEAGYHTPIVKVDRRTERYPLIATAFWREAELHLAYEARARLAHGVHLDLGASLAMMRPLDLAGVQESESQAGTINVLGLGPARTDCGGELVFVDVRDAETFGIVLVQVPVGPMPDSVAVSDDGRWVAVANERDGPDAWGKCAVPGEQPSVSIIEIPGGDPAGAVERHHLVMVDGDTGPREPESVVFSQDNDLVVVTLQDSHELLMFRVSALEEVAHPTSELDAVRIIALPGDAVGAGPWPDGVERVPLPDGKEVFAVAGEWNDMFLLVDSEGQVLANHPVPPRTSPRTSPGWWTRARPCSVRTASPASPSTADLMWRSACATRALWPSTTSPTPPRRSLRPRWPWAWRRPAGRTRTGPRSVRRGSPRPRTGPGCLSRTRRSRQ